MCGILGLFPGNTDEAEKALDAMQHRGRDDKSVVEADGGVLGHVRHAMIDDVEQPLRGDGTLVYNGEIYNWEELAGEEGVAAQNDTALLLGLLDAGFVSVGRIDGVYAYGYLRDGTLYLERDQLGVKPLWYAHTEDRFAFASEAKALKAIGLEPRELHPRTTLTYDVESGELDASVRKLSFPEPDAPLTDVLQEAVQARIPESGRVGVLFSGGVDSSLIAHLAKQAGAEVTCYIAALDDPDKKEPHDLTAAREAAELLGLDLVEVRATLEEVEELLPTVCTAIESANPVKVGVALPLWLCCERAQEDGLRAVFSGLGAEEAFAGYQRHERARDVNQECVRGLRRMHERDLYRDDVVGMTHTLEIRLPLLDRCVVGAGLAIPGGQKIVDGVSKAPLREAAIELGLPGEVAMRKKRAAQYGSQFDAAIGKLAPDGVHKGEYLSSIYSSDERLCALLSSGKDSVYALYTMQRMNYEVAVCATVLSENPDSYMYHTPLAALAEEQAGAMGVPWISARTPGEKEAELSALKDVLSRAKEEYGVSGVVSGALFSDYQRSRIERVCEELGLRVYAPLWHLDQEQEVREVLDAGFEFVFVRVAADGLDESWLARPITHDDVDALSQKLGLNVAGEGGEYETLVLDGPNFSHPVELPPHEVVCEEDCLVCEVVLT